MARIIGNTRRYLTQPIPRDHWESVRATYFLRVRSLALTEAMHP